MSDYLTRTEFDERMTAIDQKFTKIDGRFDSVDGKIDRLGAELRTEIHKANIESTKWTVGIMIAVTVLSVSIVSFVINTAAKQAPPAVIYLPTPAPK